MNNFKNILVPFVDSPSANGALQNACVISKIFNSNLTVLHIKNQNSTSEIQEKVRKVCLENQVEFTFVEKEGNIHKEILKTEKEINANLIVMGAYGISGFQAFWVGSNAFKVISASNCPVITIQNNENTFKGFTKIMLPIDDSDETRQKVNTVATIAKGFDAEVLVFCVSKSKDDEVRKKLTHYAHQVQETLDKHGIRHCFDESYGSNIATDCIKFAQWHHCDLISMMTETENSNSFFMGTYAQQLVSTSPTPVLSIHSRSVTIELTGL